jgi:hypothetical protein
MIVSINQPAYLPWLGYFNRIAISDLHIVLDHVQYEKNSFTNRNKARTGDGWCWLTVPLKTKGRFGELGINEVEIANENNWAQKHWATLQYNYARSPHFERYAGFFKEIYSRQWGCLIDLLRETGDFLREVFEIRTPVLYSSQMGVDGKKDELVLNLCRAVGADMYLSGPLGINYLREERFQDAGIEVIYHDYTHPTYRQTYPGFEPYMAAIDLLFNYGPASHTILTPQEEAIRR